MRISFVARLQILFMKYVASTLYSIINAIYVDRNGKLYKIIQIYKNFRKSKLSVAFSHIYIYLSSISFSLSSFLPNGVNRIKRFSQNKKEREEAFTGRLCARFSQLFPAETQ